MTATKASTTAKNTTATTQRVTVIEIEAAGLTWRVFNKTPSRSHATARCLSYRHTGDTLQIANGQEVLDLTDTDDIESRIIAALADRQERREAYTNRTASTWCSPRHFCFCGL